MNKDGHGRGNWGQPIVDDIKPTEEGAEGEEKKEEAKEEVVVPKSKEELEEEKAQ